jgi:hypothetical protein
MYAEIDWIKWFAKLVRNGIMSLIPHEGRDGSVASHSKLHLENLRFFGGAVIDKLVGCERTINTLRGCAALASTRLLELIDW